MGWGWGRGGWTLRLLTRLVQACAGGDGLQLALLVHLGWGCTTAETTQRHDGHELRADAGTLA